MSRITIALLLILGLTLSGCGDTKLPEWFNFSKLKAKVVPQAPKVEGTVLASVNKRVITLEDFNERIKINNETIVASKEIPESIKESYLIKTIEDKKKTLNELVDMELLIDEAIERGLDKDKEVVKALKALEDQLLAAKMIELERAKIKVEAKEVENFYNINQAAFAVPEERKVDVIVVATEVKAKELLIQLLQGVNFTNLARANSIDKSASAGGAIGFIIKRSPIPQPDKQVMFAKFEQVAFNSEPNKPSTIFKGPDGFYIIKVTEIKQPRQLLLSEVYSDIEQGLTLKRQNEAVDTLIGNLRKVSDIVVYESLLR